MIKKEKKILNQGGFTLIEMLVVIAVLAILVLLALPRLIGQTERARQAQIKNDVKVVGNAINEHLMLHHNLPDEWFNKVGLDADITAGTVYGLTGPVTSVEPNEYRIISPDFLVDNARSNLPGEFIASDDGDTYYIDENGTPVKKPDSLTEVPQGWIPIWNAQDFKSIGRDDAFPADGKFIQMAEVDMEGEEYLPFGDDTAPFKGKYNGNGHAFVNQERPLFAYVGAEAELFGITSKQVNIAYGDYMVATIAITNEGTLSDIAIEGTVTGGTYYDEDSNSMSYSSEIAGIVAMNSGGTLQNVRFDGSVIGGVNEEDDSLYAWGVSGIVSTTHGGSFENITVNATVKNKGNAAGLIQGAYTGPDPLTISNVSMTGSVESMTGSASGIINNAYNEGTISNSSFEGDITAGKIAAGIIGSGDMAIHKATVDGTIQGGTYVGGIAGHMIMRQEEYADAAAIADVSVKASIITTGESETLSAGIVAHAPTHNRSIRNATFEGTVQGGAGRAGGISGYSFLDIENSHVIGNINGGHSVGGIAGYNQSSIIKDSSIVGNVTGTGTTVGGIAGWNNSSITNTFVKGNVSGGYTILEHGGGIDSSTGGLVGRQFYSQYPTEKGIISKSYIIGDVSGVSEVGGLVGQNYSPIRESYIKGNVTATEDYAGGLVGRHFSKTLERSYALGDVTGNNFTGLIAGTNHATIKDVFARGTIVAGETNVASTIGMNTSDIENIFVESNDSLAVVNSDYAETKSVHRFAPGTNYELHKAALIADEWDFTTVWEIKDGKLQLQ